MVLPFVSTPSVLPLPPPQGCLQAEHSPDLTTPVVTTLTNIPFPATSHRRAILTLMAIIFLSKK
jgi:hypothetical protein